MSAPEWILALDPGNVKSGYVLTHLGEIAEKGIESNAEVLEFIDCYAGKGCGLAVETVAAYGMAVGKTVFQTCFWTGRFVQVAIVGGCRDLRAVYRKNVKLHLCNSLRAKDANVRQAIIDRHPATGGGSIPQIGTKSKPGPLYGVSSHLWAALGVAITARETWWDCEVFPGVEIETEF